VVLEEKVKVGERTDISRRDLDLCLVCSRCIGCHPRCRFLIYHNNDNNNIIIILFQRISVSLQRFNSILFHDSFVREDCPE